MNPDLLPADGNLSGPTAALTVRPQITFTTGAKKKKKGGKGLENMALGSLKPPTDPELLPIQALWSMGDYTLDNLHWYRDQCQQLHNLEGALSGQNKDYFTHEEHVVPGPHGPVTLSVFRPKDKSSITSEERKNSSTTKARPAIYHVHPGGMICGNRFMLIREPLRWALSCDAVLIAVEHRLAPEHPFPAPLDDCWTGLQWVAGRAASDLGVDPSRVLVSGQSSGANLASALTMLARENKGPRLCGQVLDSGMLDDRMTSTSMSQYISGTIWNRSSNAMAWSAYLESSRKKSGGQQERERGDGVSYLAAPSRATNLEGLPPAYISVGSADGLRDENIAFAGKLWAAGVQTELHIWPGGIHLFDSMVPDANISRASAESRLNWIKKILAPQLKPTL